MDTQNTISYTTATGERRYFTDRRRQPTRFTLMNIFTPGRRRAARRKEETANSYYDQLTPFASLWVLAIVVLSGFDAALTLIHIQHGGEEVVPTMRWAIGQSPLVFINMKMGLTAVGTILLAMHQHFRLAKLAISFVLISYLSLMIYHSVLVYLHW